MHLLLLAESTRGLVLSDVTLELVLLTLEGAPVLPPEWTTADWIHPPPPLSRPMCHGREIKRT